MTGYPDQRTSECVGDRQLLGASKLLLSIHTRPSNYLRTPETSDTNAIRVCKKSRRSIRGIEEASVKRLRGISTKMPQLTQIVANARSGLGAVGLGPRIISYASLTSTETRYSQKRNRRSNSYGLAKSSALTSMTSHSSS